MQRAEDGRREKSSRLNRYWSLQAIFLSTVLAAICVGCYDVASYDGKVSEPLQDKDITIEVRYRDSCPAGDDVLLDLILIGPVVKPIMCTDNAFDSGTHVAGGALGVMASAVPFVGSCSKCSDPLGRQGKIRGALEIAKVPEAYPFASQWSQAHQDGDLDAAKVEFTSQTKSSYENSADQLFSTMAGADDISIVADGRSIPFSQASLSAEFSNLAERAANDAWPEPENSIKESARQKQQEVEQQMEKQAQEAAAQKAKDEALDRASDPEKFATAREAMSNYNWALASRALDRMSPEAKSNPLWAMSKAQSEENQGNLAEALDEYRTYNRLVPGQAAIIEKIGNLEYRLQTK